MKEALCLFLLLLLGACELPPAEQLPKLPPDMTTPVRVATGSKAFYQCSGVQIHKDWALTAKHCVDESMWVNGFKVELVITPSPEWDMAILHVPGLPGKDVVWADHKPGLGETIHLVGWGCSTFHTRAEWKSGVIEDVDDRDLTLSVPVCGGDSGSPAVDDQGRLIGLLSRAVESNMHAVVEYLAE